MDKNKTKNVIPVPSPNSENGRACKAVRCAARSDPSPQTPRQPLKRVAAKWLGEGRGRRVDRWLPPLPCGV